MAKHPSEEGEKPKKLSTYTIKLDDEQMDKLETILETRGWTPFDVPYSRFAFRGTDCNVTAYDKRKVVVVAGKGTEEFVVNTLEPEVTKAPRLGYDEVLHPDWFESHAGLDESGKGDFFGPTITATVIADKAAVESWIKAGVKDSKRLVDTQIIKLDKLIRETPGVAVEVFPWTMAKYNELMLKQTANVNRLLGWQHAKTLMRALDRKWVPWGLLDQFTEQPLVQRELAKGGVSNFELRMRTKAEEDPVVAAASIVARAEYVRQMADLSKAFGDKLQKGASAAVKEQGLEIVRRFGAKALTNFAKLHFRTAYEVVQSAGKLDELPLREPKERVEWER
ncbi:ribonuclease HIII [Opitutaceae bacterium EW11]|nr:ribonuclease HIII [Opitutaceae bacterium EW11]